VVATGSRQNAAIQVNEGDALPATIVAAKSGYAIAVEGYVLIATDNAPAWPDGPIAQATWQDSSGQKLSGPFSLRDSIPLTVPAASQTDTDLGSWFQTASGASLQLNTTGASVVAGHLTWFYIAQ
jgi:hypothetical protein